MRFERCFARRFGCGTSSAVGRRFRPLISAVPARDRALRDKEAIEAILTQLYEPEIRAFSMTVSTSSVYVPRLLNVVASSES
jgi:hypothetical protein